jgi:hypothetical protein
MAQTELAELKKTIQKLSGNEAGKNMVLFEVAEIAKGKAGKTAEKLLKVLTEYLKFRNHTGYLAV